MATIIGSNGNDSGLSALFGTGGNDYMSGLNGHDQMFGLNGHDTMYGGAGNDLMSGGNGNDRLYGGTGRDHLHGDEGNDSLMGESGLDVLYGGNGNDQLFGGADSDTLYGDAGNDQLYGGDGDDWMYGGAGNDQFFGDAGKDVMNGGAGHDTVSYAASTAHVVIQQHNQFVWGQKGSGGHAEGDYLYDIEKIIGSRYGDYIDGAGGETVQTLDGGAGDDWIQGYGGGDLLIGGAGFDMLSYAASNAGVTVNLALGTASGGHATGDKFSGFEGINGSAHADTLTGNSAANRLSGNGGNDKLYGGHGDDTLTGGTGTDQMWGGAGSDTFVFGWSDHSGKTAGNRDIIQDFQKGYDTIDLSGIDAKAGTALNNAFSFIGQGQFSAEGQVRYSHSGGKTVIELNIQGNAGAEMQIELTGIHNLSASDFLL